MPFGGNGEDNEKKVNLPPCADDNNPIDA